jgi:hypothetical protein
MCSLLRLFGLWGAVLSTFVIVGSASARDKYLAAPPIDEVNSSPAYRYANLSNSEAYAELDRRQIPYVREPERVPGVRAPVRLHGKLHGVAIHSALPEEERSHSIYEVLDARLALALDDFCRILAVHDVVEAIHFTMYRPGGTRGLASDKFLFRHPGGLAIDLGALRKRNGELLSVSPDWPGSIGSKTCGFDGRKLKSRRGRELMSILCEAADLRLFHYMLTPHFNRRHHDHLHLEIKPGVKQFLVN